VRGKKKRQSDLLAGPADPRLYAGSLFRYHFRLRRRAVTSLVVSVLLLWAVGVAVDLYLAARHVRQGAEEVTAARSTLSADGLLSGAPVAPLHSAESDFTAGRSLLASPLLWPVEILPVLGRQLRSIQDLASAAGQVSATGITAVSQTRSLLQAPHTTGPQRIALLDRLANLASSTHTRLSGVDLGPSEALLGPVARQRNTFSGELNQVQTTLSRAAAGASAAATILQGPQQYLLLASNNAEMRSGSGAFLEAGLVTTSGGELHLSDMQPTTNLTLPVGAVSVGGDLEARWGWLLPGVDWRNLGVTPQFDVNAPLAAQMWEASTGQKVDGVMALDVTGLQDLLSVTGPVTTQDGTVISAGNVDQVLLHDQYVGEGYNSSNEDQAARVDELGSLAGAVMRVLENQPLDIHATADAMSSATAGRHLLLWSADPSTEAVWRSTGVSGQLVSNSLLADVINRGGNKLDQYLSVGNTLRLVTHGGRTSGTLTMTLANHTPPGQSAFIAGPYPGLGTRYGEYVGIATVNLPGDVRDVSMVSGETVAVDGPEGPTLLVGVDVDLLPGATKQYTFRFSLPQPHGTFALVPSARVPAEEWKVNGSTISDQEARNVNW
jgi:hypothetical protein